jgi:hypothetical protein
VEADFLEYREHSLRAANGEEKPSCCGLEAMAEERKDVKVLS